MTVALVDTHAHLEDPAFERDLDDVMERAASTGVERILSVGSDLSSSRRAVTIAHRYAMVYAAVGIHPHQAARFEEEREEIEALLDAEKVVAVGEIGLDYHRDFVPRETQLRVFSMQLNWARERGLPASIHNRDADADVLETIADVGARAVMHAFGATATTAVKAVEAGAYISFAGNVTYPKADVLRVAAAEVPSDRILIESDAPVLAPQPRRGKRNEPAFVQFTLQRLAQVLAMPDVAVGEQTRSNAARLFGWGGR